MSDFEVDTSKLARLGTDLVLAGPRVAVGAVGAARFHGALMLGRWRRNASQPRTTARGPGTGGLRLFTGDYLGRLNLRVGVEGGEVVASVSTDHPGARRLEWGFSGVDALGREVDSPPYPTAEPALAETEPGFMAALEAMAAEEVGR